MLLRTYFSFTRYLFRTVTSNIVDDIGFEALKREIISIAKQRRK